MPGFLRNFLGHRVIRGIIKKKEERYMDCPKCIGKLEKTEVRLSKVYVSGKMKGKAVTQILELDKCFVCSGVWFDSGELKKYFAEKITIVDSPPIPPEMKNELDRKTGKCPRCGIDMIKKAAPKDPSIVIDFCEKCKGIWLDNTEIDELEKANEGFGEKISRILNSLFQK